MVAGDAAAMAAIAAAALTMAACDGETGAAVGAVVRDSAGVRIVEYAGTPQHGEGRDGCRKRWWSTS